MQDQISIPQRTRAEPRCLHGRLFYPNLPYFLAAAIIASFGAIGSEAKSEWFRYGIRAVGTHIQFWINDKLVMTHDDAEYKAGRFAIQGHNPGMKIEAKELHYTDLSK